jgi:hypothetical protein
MLKSSAGKMARSCLQRSTVAATPVPADTPAADAYACRLPPDTQIRTGAVSGVPIPLPIRG